MSLLLSFNSEEAEVILNWYENSRVKSERFGPARYYFPQEDFLVEKLNNTSPNTFFDEMDVEIILGWMEKSIRPAAGKEQFYFPLEEEIADKLKKAKKQLETELKDESDRKREEAIEYADRLIYEKKLALEKEQQRKLKQRLSNERKTEQEAKNKKRIAVKIKSYLEKFF